MSGFSHEALFYRGDQEFLDAMLPFVREGIAQDQPMLVMLPEPKLRRLREAMGSDASAIRFQNPQALGRNPARIIPHWMDFVDEHAQHGGQLRGVAETICPAGRAEDLDEHHAHEALLNVAFADGPALSLVCPYDVGAVSAETISTARTTHRFVTEAGRRAEAAQFANRSPFAGQLPPPPVEPTQNMFTADDLAGVRRQITAETLNAGLGQRACDVVLAVNELAANSIRHGGGSGILRTWVTADRFVCEVADDGVIDEPLVGRRRPSPDSRGGIGLWIVNQVCDLVQIRSGEGGTVVRVHVIRG